MWRINHLLRHYGRCGETLHLFAMAQLVWITGLVLGSFNFLYFPPSSTGQPQNPQMMDSLTVYIFLEDECKISQFFTPELSRLHEKYNAQHVGFVGIFPNKTTGPEQIRWFGQEFKLSFALLPDYDKSLTKKLGITITPEAAVWDHRSGRMIYRGRIDDSYVRVGKRKIHPQNHDLEDIIQDWTLNQVPEMLVKTQAIGCFITFE